MDEPVRWVTKAEAAQELEVSVSTLVGPVTADRYSRVMTALKAKGRPIPTNDVWIAAHAMETGADLVSADGHFEHVDGIVWVRVTGG